MNNLFDVATISSVSAITSSVLTTADKIQLAIASVTFLAVLVALFGERIWKWKDRPRISISFKNNDSECYHLTDMHILQNGRIIEAIPSYYIRIRVTNTGRATLENTEVVLEDVKPKPDKFMSLNLSWAGFIQAQNDIKRTIRIPRGQTRILDVIEVMEPSQTKALADRLLASNDTDANRYKSYSEGFRCCSIKPNTLSDVFPAGEYIFQLGVYADDVKPKFFKLSIKYQGMWGAEGIKGMRKKYLRVRLLKEVV